MCMVRGLGGGVFWNHKNKISGAAIREYLKRAEGRPKTKESKTQGGRGCIRQRRERERQESKERFRSRLALLF